MRPSDPLRATRPGDEQDGPAEATLGAAPVSGLSTETAEAEGCVPASWTDEEYRQHLRSLLPPAAGVRDRSSWRFVGGDVQTMERKARVRE